MFRIAVSALALACYSAVRPAVAQHRELSFRAGGTLSGATGGNLGTVHERPGFVAGLSLRFQRTQEFAIQGDLLVIQRRVLGRLPAGTQPSLLTGPLTDAANLLFLQVPLLLRFQRRYALGRSVRPWLVIGPYVGYRLTCHREVTETTGNLRETDCSVAAGEFNAGDETFQLAVYQDVDLGLLGGVGLELGRFGMGARFERSLRTFVASSGLVRTSPFEGSNLWAVSFSLEYLVRVW